MNVALTKEGQVLLLSAFGGESITFSCVKLGNGGDAGLDASALSNPLVTVDLTDFQTTDTVAKITGMYTNQGITDGFRITEMGVFAQNPADEDQEILYAYGYTPVDSADFLSPSTDGLVETKIVVDVYIGEAESVTAAITEGLTYASKADLDAHTANKKNPHAVTAAQIGLGNVQNYATNDQKPTYTVPATAAALTSGEKLGVAMGKISRAVTNLIAHIANKKNPHAVTAAQVGAAKESHSHAATAINSGTLGVARGGTGHSGYQTSGGETQYRGISIATSVPVTLTPGTICLVVDS